MRVTVNRSFDLVPPLVLFLVFVALVESSFTVLAGAVALSTCKFVVEWK